MGSRQAGATSRLPSLIRPQQMRREKELGAASLTEGLAAELRRLIQAGRLARGERLPASRILAKDLGLSRNTVTAAYAQLVAEGYLATRTGAGTYVEHRLPEDNLPQSPAPRNWAAEEPTLARRAAAALDVNPAWQRSGQFALSPGVPALDLYPREAFARIARSYWRGAARRDLGYGDEDEELRAELVRYLSQARGLDCRPEQVIVVGSSLQAFMLIAHVLCDVGDGVVIEDPGYATAAAMLTATGLRPCPEPVDGQGLDVTRFSPAAMEARLAIVSPVAQYPYGCDMTPARRDALCRWALERRVWLVEDDFNSEHRWEGTPLPPLAAGPAAGQIIHVSSLNRVLAPGLKLAYLVVPERLIPAFSGMSDILSLAAPGAHQRIVADFMASGGLAAHLRQMRSIYRERSEALAAALDRRLRTVFEIPAVQAGLHMTLRARLPLDDARLSLLLRRRWIDAPALSSYALLRRDLRGLVLGFGNTPPRSMEMLVSRIAESLGELETTP